MIQIEHRIENGILMVSFDGRLDASSSDATTETLGNLLAGKPSGVILDLGRLTYCSSAGLRVLLLLVKRCRADGSKLAIHSLDSGVRQVIELSGLSNTFPLFQDQAASQAALKS